MRFTTSGAIQAHTIRRSMYPGSQSERRPGHFLPRSATFPSPLSAIKEIWRLLFGLRRVEEYSQSVLCTLAYKIVDFP